MIDEKPIVDAIQAHPAYRAPDLVLVLGSGLGALADRVGTADIPYADIPGFPRPTVHGHSGRMVFAEFDNRTVLMFQGRFHFYEGHDMTVVTLFARLAAGLGAKGYLVTNAAGGVNPDFRAGDLMVIRDHLNLMGTNPLIGSNRDDLGPRFPDMTAAYDPVWSETFIQVARGMGVTLQQGVYAALTGPSYETPAEIRMLRALGADAVGMSTVPEVIVACHAGLRVAGISCITNMAAGVTGEPLSHDEVLETGRQVEQTFIELMHRFLATATL